MCHIPCSFQWLYLMQIYYSVIVMKLTLVQSVGIVLLYHICKFV